MNQFARLCAQGKPIPEEENDPEWGSCFLLENDICSMYPNRPFGCRALLSTHDCKKKGFAQVPPYLLTLNNIMLQYIEHLDKGGFSGNLADMLNYLIKPDPIKENQPADCRLPSRFFLRNEAISVLMAPPEHRSRIRVLIDTLNDILK